MSFLDRLLITISPLRPSPGLHPGFSHYGVASGNFLMSPNNWNANESCSHYGRVLWTILRG